MQEHFLFDDEDPKQVGKGCDSLRRSDKRLRFNWNWPLRYKWAGGETHAKTKTRFAGGESSVELKNGWRLCVGFHYSEYSVEIERYGEQVDEYHVRYDCKSKKNKPLFTRLDAQLKAEELFGDLGADIMRQFADVRKGSEYYEWAVE